ncbi:MAG: hypothetical protein AAF517_15000 [Planctomycetota bacterium]
MIRRTTRLIAILLTVVFVTEASADTIFLKNGTQIMNCKVTDETPQAVSCKTPSGDMVVPRSAIARVVKQRTVYDDYKAQYAKLRKGDTKARYKLALWARNRAELRGESHKVLQEILAIDAKHAGAHKLLGHLYVDGKWIVPEKTVVFLRTTSNDAELRNSLELLFSARSDFRLGSAAEAKKPPKDYCVFDAYVSISKKQTRLYGGSVGGPSFAAGVKFRASSSWLGKRPLTTQASGYAPSNTPNGKAQAVNNAMGTSSRGLHLFLDKLTAKRLAEMKKELAKKSDSKSKSKKSSKKSSKRA